MATGTVAEPYLNWGSGGEMVETTPVTAAADRGEWSVDGGAVGDHDSCAELFGLSESVSVVNDEFCNEEGCLRMMIMHGKCFIRRYHRELCPFCSLCRNQFRVYAHV